MGKGGRAIGNVGKKNQGVSMGSKRERVSTVDAAWFIVQSLISRSGGSSGTVVLLTTTVTTAMTATSFQWQYQLTYKCKVVESVVFGVTASGFWISAGISFVPIFLALPADKREQGDANLCLAFTGYSGIIPQSPIANRSYLVTG